MSGAILRSEQPTAVHGKVHGHVHGHGRVVFRENGGVTRLADLYQHDPVRVLFPATPLAELTEALQAAVVTTSGGLVGGDVIEIEVNVGGGARALIMPQAAEKVYRSNGGDVRIDVRLNIADGGWLEWLPQETIVFDAARLRRLTTVEFTGGGRFLAGEILAFGRRASGEKLSRGLIREAWEVRREGRLIWADALHMEGDIGNILNHPAAFDGAAAQATAVYGGLDAENLLDAASAMLTDPPGGVRAAAGLVNGLLVARWLAEDGLRLRLSFAAFWAAFRAEAAGLAFKLPRLWYI